MSGTYSRKGLDIRIIGINNIHDDRDKPDQKYQDAFDDITSDLNKVYEDIKDKYDNLKTDFDDSYYYYQIMVSFK